MQMIKFHIKTQSPLVIASNTGDPNMVATTDFIPGTYILGVFANAYIKVNKLEKKLAYKDEKFHKWFLKGDLKITNAYITMEKDNKIHSYYPIPFSIQRLKDNQNEGYDLIFYDEIEKQTKSLDGYCRLVENTLYKVSVKKSLNFHHSRDRERGVSKEGMIFNYESIDPEQIFEGYIIGEKGDLQEFLKIFKNGTYYIGRSRNNQYGKVEIKIINREPQDFLEKDDVLSSPNEAVITFLSDTIIYNDYGYSTTDIKDLEKYSGLKIKKAFIKQTEEEGFISVWKLKTPQEICFKGGSCFLVELKEGDIEKLKSLQKKGIGERTNEGFGRFVINWQKNEGKIKIINDTTEIIDIEPPKLEQCESVKKIVKDVIKEELKKRVELEALRKVNDFSDLPPKSLLSKLEALVINNKLPEFLDALKDTKKIAKVSLEKCRDKDNTLLEFLGKKHIDIGNLKNSIENLDKIFNEISYQPENEEKFIDELEKTFLITFISNMRKKIKQQEREK